MTLLISSNQSTIHIVIGIPFINNLLCVHSGGRFWVCLFQIHLGHLLNAIGGQQKKLQVFDFDKITIDTLLWKKKKMQEKKT
jgi:hypothetical protein